MQGNAHRSSGVGLEGSRSESATDWLRSTDGADGVECLEAWLHGAAYRPHRHDTYAVCLTTSGVQAFAYRGESETSLPGQVTVLHPDEVHDGHAGTAEGLGYRLLYVAPRLIFEAVQELCGRPCALPFVRKPVVNNGQLSSAILGAFQGRREPLAIDCLVVQLAEGLLAEDPSCRQAAMPRHLDLSALERARQFLDAEHARVVRSVELERVTGLTRYDLARQFRVWCGTSPYRYLVMRRLAHARTQLARERPLVEVAFEAGFADQAHFSRMFKAAFGITPARYKALRAQAPSFVQSGSRAMSDLPLPSQLP